MCCLACLIAECCEECAFTGDEKVCCSDPDCKTECPPEFT